VTPKNVRPWRARVRRVALATAVGACALAIVVAACVLVWRNGPGLRRFDAQMTLFEALLAQPPRAMMAREGERFLLWPFPFIHGGLGGDDGTRVVGGDLDVIVVWDLWTLGDARVTIRDHGAPLNGELVEMVLDCLENEASEVTIEMAAPNAGH